MYMPLHLQPQMRCWLHCLSGYLLRQFVGLYAAWNFFLLHFLDTQSHSLCRHFPAMYQPCSICLLKLTKAASLPRPKLAFCTCLIACRTSGNRVQHQVAPWPPKSPHPAPTAPIDIGFRGPRPVPVLPQQHECAKQEPQLNSLCLL